MVLNKAMNYAIQPSGYIASVRMTIDTTYNSIRKLHSINYITQSSNAPFQKCRTPESRDDCHGQSIDNNHTDVSLDA